MFPNAPRVLSQCNTRLRLLYLLNIHVNSSSGENNNFVHVPLNLNSQVSLVIVFIKISLFGFVRCLPHGLSLSLRYGPKNLIKSMLLQKEALIKNKGMVGWKRQNVCDLHAGFELTNAMLFIGRVHTVIVTITTPGAGYTASIFTSELCWGARSCHWK